MRDAIGHKIVDQVYTIPEKAIKRYYGWPFNTFPTKIEDKPYNRIYREIMSGKGPSVANLMFVLNIRNTELGESLSRRESL